MLARYQIPNGKSKGRHASDFDAVQLRIGTKVEMEHTTDPRIAQRIAMDHLTEDRDYYKKLAMIHLDGPVMTDLDCRKEIVKFRDKRGRLVQFTRHVGRDCPKRRRPSTRHLRPWQYESKETRRRRAEDPRLNGAECSTSPRWVRGGVGFLLGTLLGGMIGSGVAFAVTTTQLDLTEPVAAIKRAKNMAVVATGVTVLGATGGLALGAAKPEC